MTTRLRARHWLSSTLILLGVAVTSLNVAWVVGASVDGGWGVSLGATLLAAGFLLRGPHGD